MQVASSVSKWDMNQWEQALSQMDMQDWPSEAIARVKWSAAKAGHDKLHMLTAIIGLGIIRMSVRNYENIKHRTQLDGNAEVKRMGTVFDFSKSDIQKATSIVTDPKTQEIWSNSLWVDTDKLANDAEALVNKHLKHGMSLQDLESILESHANPKQFNPGQSVADRIHQMEFNARRIVRTESARLVNQVNMATYRANGIQYVAWVTEPGACDKCEAIAESGPYAIGDVPDIPGDSHPNCRCHITPLDPTLQNLRYYYKVY